MLAGSDFLLYALVLVATWATVGVLRRLLLRRAVLDRPNARSSHATPTPRGAGLVLTPILATAWIWIGLDRSWDPTWMAVPLGALALGALSWWDDLRDLPAWPRLVGHLIVAFGVLGVAAPGPLFGGLLPGWLDLAATGLAWVWFVNLYNFMDGIDGITGVQTATLGFGAATIALVAGLPAGFEALGLACGLAALAFLAWNWHPAKIFLGDVGSVPLGFLLGWLLIVLAAEGQPAPAMILAAYYLADATLTVLRRAVRRRNVLSAHREHFYQLAVRGGWTHDRVAMTILGADALLLVLALIAVRHPLPALAVAVLVTGLLLHALARPFRMRKGLAP